MLNKLTTTSGLLLLLSFFVLSCKKDKSEPKAKTDVLTGAWKEAGLTGGFTRLIIFEAGGGFSLQASDKNGVIVTLKGNYSIASDNLKVNITEQTERQVNGSMLKTTVNSQVFEKGKFSITEHFILTINHITYPADAPVPTTSKFNKLIPID